MINWPTDLGRITQHFGENPNNKYLGYGSLGHNGLDIGVPVGSNVLAFADGEVAWVGKDAGYGNYVRIWHPGILVNSFYAHLSEQLVAVGGKVEGGQVIGLSGNTGNSTGPHLHFEIRCSVSKHIYRDVGNMRARGRIDPLIAWTLGNMWLGRIDDVESNAG